MVGGRAGGGKIEIEEREIERERERGGRENHLSIISTAPITEAKGIFLPQP